jgi:hypothetical protein
MEAVSRLATIQAASASLGEDSLLRALTQEIRDLRVTFTSSSHHGYPRQRREPIVNVKKFMGGTFRKELYPYFITCGGSQRGWPKVLQTKVPPNEAEQFQSWGMDEWKQYVACRAKDYPADASVETATAAPEETKLEDFDPNLLASVQSLLPSQPWPYGIHKQVADKLGIANSVVSKCIKELIRRGIFVPQVDGQLSRSEETD